MNSSPLYFIASGVFMLVSAYTDRDKLSGFGIGTFILSLVFLLMGFLYQR